MLGNNIDELKFGDELWAFELGDCKVTQIDLNRKRFKAESIKTGSSIIYSYDGQKCNPLNDEMEKEQSVFWAKPKFEIPKKPFELKKAIKEMKRIDNKTNEKYFLAWDNKKNQIMMVANIDVEIPNTIYFDYKSIGDLLEKTQGKEITKEQFFKVMKELYLEWVK